MPANESKNIQAAQHSQITQDQSEIEQIGGGARLQCFLFLVAKITRRHCGVLGLSESKSTFGDDTVVASFMPPQVSLRI